MQPEAVAVPLQQLHAIVTAVEEHEQAAVEGIVAKRIADHRQQTVVRLAAVDRVARDEDPDARWQAQHDRNAATRLLSQVKSMPLCTSISTSLPTRRITTGLGLDASGTSSTKRPDLCPASSPRRSRQLHQDRVPMGIPVSFDSFRRLRPSRSRRASSADISLRRFMPQRFRRSTGRPEVLHATVTESARRQERTFEARRRTTAAGSTTTTTRTRPSAAGGRRRRFPTPSLARPAPTPRRPRRAPRLPRSRTRPRAHPLRVRRGAGWQVDRAPVAQPSPCVASCPQDTGGRGSFQVCLTRRLRQN